MNPSPEHILIRSIVHFFSAGIILFAFAHILDYAKLRARNLELNETVILCGLVILWTAAMREAYDVWNGGALIKSLFDFASWFIMKED